MIYRTFYKKLKNTKINNTHSQHTLLMNNIYSVTKDLNIKDNSNYNTYLEAGIHEDVVLTDVKYGVTEKGFEYLTFTFENKQGDKGTHTEYQVFSDKQYEAMLPEDRERFLEKIDNQKRRIGQIVTTFVTREQYEFQANDFKTYAENIINILKDSLNTVPVRIKFVYNNRGFTTLPSYWKYIFIEPMTITKEQSKIRILSIDKMKRDVPNIKSQPNTEIEDLVVTNKSTDDIPF